MNRRSCGKTNYYLRTIKDLKYRSKEINYVSFYLSSSTASNIFIMQPYIAILLCENKYANTALQKILWDWPKQRAAAIIGTATFVVT